MYEIELALESADWRVAKAHKLPIGCTVRYLSFDSSSRCFALAYDKVFGGSFSRRVSVLDGRLVEAVKLPLPNVSNLFSCCLRGTMCLVDCVYSVNEKLSRRQLLYDICSRSVLQCFDDGNDVTNYFITVYFTGAEVLQFVDFHYMSTGNRIRRSFYKAE